MVDDSEDDRMWRWGQLGPTDRISQPKPAAAKKSEAATKTPAASGAAKLRLQPTADQKPSAKKPLVATPSPAPAKLVANKADAEKRPAPEPSDAKAAIVVQSTSSKSKLPPIIKPSTNAKEPPRQFVKCAIVEQQRPAFAALIGRLQSADLMYFTGGGVGPYVQRVNLLRDDNVKILAIIEAIRNKYECYMQLASGSILNIREFRDSWAKWPLSFTLLIMERSCIAGGFNQVHVSSIEVALWSVADSYSTDRSFQTDMPHRSFSKIREKTIRKMFTTRDDSDREEAGDVYTCNFPIDIVYTWVNDQDVAWQRRKDRVSLKHHRPANAGARAKLSERFRNRDELRFSFRSVEMFAPFVRKIFLVTDDQTPDWLDTSHPKVEVVSHRSIYKDRTVLPTFNSSGIETQLHHVHGLSEHFLYFNDDFFLGDVVSAEDFFMGNGAIRCFPSDQYANEKDIDEEREEYVVADKNAIDLFKADFGMLGRNIMLHVPYPSSKSLIDEMEARYQRHFDVCASNPFRSMQDLRPIAFMQYHYGFRHRSVVPSAISHRYLALWKPTIQEQLDNVLRTRRYKTICINDVGIPPEREVAVNNAVKAFLEGYFPFKSSFEK